MNVLVALPIVRLESKIIFLVNDGVHILFQEISHSHLSEDLLIDICVTMRSVFTIQKEIKRQYEV